MTLAERITHDMLKNLGHDDPRRHSKWETLEERAQDHIDAEIDAMTRIAEEDARRNLSPRPKLSTILFRIGAAIAQR